MHQPQPTLNLPGPTVMVVPWHDPVVDTIGHDVQGTYVEVFWLNILGPTATWALRRMVAGLEHYPLGYELDLQTAASSLGLSYTSSTSNAFVRALHRCMMFGATQPLPDALAVRRRLPPVASRHLARMPASMRQLHQDWQVRQYSIDELHRARTLAAAMQAAGDEPAVWERQLLALGVPPAAAAVAAVAAHANPEIPAPAAA